MNSDHSVQPNPPWVIVHIPHASKRIPDSVRPELLLTDDLLESELNRLTDHYTDELFAIRNARTSTLRFPISRFVVDPERFPDDETEPMAARGQGVIYTETTSRQPLRNPPNVEARHSLLDRWYWPHHRELEARTRAALEAHERALIIDAHSFPNRPLPVDMDQTFDRPDFCLGTDPYHTPQPLLDATREFLEGQGYTVGINRPYAGTMVPTFAFESDPRVMSIMIEVNRRLYIRSEPDDIQKSKAFDDVRNVVLEVIRAAVGAASISLEMLSVSVIPRRST